LPCLRLDRCSLTKCCWGIENYFARFVMRARSMGTVVVSKRDEKQLHTPVLDTKADPFRSAISGYHCCFPEVLEFLWWRRERGRDCINCGRVVSVAQQLRYLRRPKGERASAVCLAGSNAHCTSKVRAVVESRSSRERFLEITASRNSTRSTCRVRQTVTVTGGDILWK